MKMKPTARSKSLRSLSNEDMCQRMSVALLYVSKWAMSAYIMRLLRDLQMQALITPHLRICTLTGI